MAGLLTVEELFPSQAIDQEFYYAEYPDVARAGVDPWEHYRRWGHKEGRLWNEAARPLADVLLRRPDFIIDLLNATTVEIRMDLLVDLEAWTAFRMMIHPDFYAAQLSGSTGESDSSTETSAVWAVDDVIDHYFAAGIREGLRPSLYFHEKWYRQSAARLIDDPVEGHPFLHWMAVGRRARVSPTPLFDEQTYTSSHRDMAGLGYWSFSHFISHGAYEAFRRASPVVRDLKADPSARSRQRPLILDLATRDVEPLQLRTSTPLEELALFVGTKRARLESATMQEMIQKAYDIEPLIRRPYGPREISIPPMVNHATGLSRRAESFRRDLGITSVDTIVLVPHVRMAGSARVAGVFARAMRELEPDETMLVLTTEAETFERPDWFGGDLLVGDISQYMDGLPEEAKTRLLLDAVRGLQPRRVMNINSRRAWELFRLFGRQLSAITELYAYLFTWDLDARGNKGGYPITYFPECFGNLSGILVDSAPLRDELVQRYARSKDLRRRITLVHTPFDADSEEVDHSAVFAARRARGVRRRLIWCGRFDRQKRFDVVVDFARQMPDIEFWVWGKTVLGGLDIDMSDLPGNITLQGTYDDFDDLPFESADAFLYTAEWDGVPTILIDAGVRGIAVIASAVGGVTDLVTEETGYPVEAFADANAYVKAIEFMSENPDDVTRRAAALRGHVRSVCSPDAYHEALRDVFAVTAGNDSRTIEGYHP